MIQISKPTNANLPLVSVLIPTYNMAGTLRACLDSVINQNYPALEIIVSDNHSTDQTVEVLEQFRGKRSLRDVQPDKHVNMYANFNWALRFAQGEIIKFLCADDVLLPKALERIVEHFQEYPSVGVLQFGGPCLDERGASIGPYEYNRHIRMGMWRGRDLVFAQVPSMDLATPSHTAFRRNLLSEADINGQGPFETSMIQADWDLLLRLFQRCDVYRIPGDFVGYRVTGYHKRFTDTTWALADALRIAEKYYGKRHMTGGRHGRCRRIIQNNVSERFVWWIFKRIACGQLSLARRAVHILQQYDMLFPALLHAICSSPLYLARKVMAMR